MARHSVIIVAGGSGSRMGTTLPKQFLMLGNEPVLARTINTFAEALPAADIVVVLPEEHISLWHNLSARFEVAPHRTVAGGRERFDSVRAGIEALTADTAFIAVHDGVRSMVSKRLIIRTLLDAETHGASIPVIGVADSYRRITEGGSEIVPRGDLRIVQTPQIFRAELLREAYTQPFDSAFTDDASVVESLGHSISLVEGERTNIKLTTPDDLAFAEWLIAREEA